MASCSQIREKVNLITITKDKAMEIIDSLKSKPLYAFGWKIAVLKQLEAKFAPLPACGEKYIQEFREMKRKERENVTKIEPTVEETRRVFNIDVGNMSQAEALKSIEKTKREIQQRTSKRYDPELTKAKLQEGIEQEISNRAKQIKELQEKCDFSIDEPEDYVDNLSESMRSLLAKYNKQFNCMFAFSHPVFAVKDEITRVKDIVDEFAIFGNIQYSELYTQISGPFVNSQDVMKLASEFKDESVKNKDMFTMIRYDGAMKSFLACNQHLIHELNKHARFNISDYMMNDLQRYVDLRNRLSSVTKSIKKLDIKIGPIQAIDGIDTDIAAAHMEIASNKMRDFS